MNTDDARLREAVEEIAAGVTPPDPPTSLRPGAPPRSPIRRPVLLIGAVIVVAASAWLWFARQRPPVVVEFLRIDGMAVSAPGVQIYSLPEADAVIIRVDAADGEDPSSSRGRPPLHGDWKFAGAGLLPVGAAAGLPGDEGESGLPVYHVRLFRARWESGITGSALFRPENQENWIPVSEHEVWGAPNQLQRLQEALAARAIEAIPGLVIEARQIGFDEPFRFDTALGQQLLEISFAGEKLWPGQHRVQVAAHSDGGKELLATQLLISGRQTVVLVAPLPEDEGALLVAVTPLFGDFPWIAKPVDIYQTDSLDVAYPKNIHWVIPVYPDKARKERMEGDVLLQVVVRKTGDVDGIVVLKMPEGGEDMAGAVVDAVSGWKYEPAIRNGEPVDAFMVIVTKFYLEEKEDG